MTQGRQLQVFAHPDDTSALGESLVTALDGRLLARRWPTVHPIDPGPEDPFVLLSPSALVDAVHPVPVAGRDELVPEITDSPVVEWHRSKLVDDLLYVGRFYYTPTTRSGRPQEKAFVDFATAMFRWLRRNLTASEVGGRRVLCTAGAVRGVVDETLQLSLLPGPGPRPQAGGPKHPVTSSGPVEHALVDPFRRLKRQ